MRIQDEVPGHDVADAKPVVNRKRARHTKVKTGCKTCKIRRIRCDESKPHCKRCISTGRKCDGYDTTAMYPLPRTAATLETHPQLQARLLGSDARADVALYKIGRPPEELRSYQFFVDVAAPSIGGAMNTDFWSRHIPRLCHLSPAIWHAAISLASAHESFVSGRPRDGSLKPNAFTIRHFNAAIRELTGPSASSEPWAALIASTLFACISILEDQLGPAETHFRAGCKLLGEAQMRARMRGGSSLERVATSDNDEPSVGQSTLRNFVEPVPLTSVQSILVGFEMVTAKLDAATTSRPPSLLVPGLGYSAWQRYRAPGAPPAFGRRLNADNLTKAVAAAESLFMTLLISLLVQNNRLQQLFDQGGYERLRSESPYRDSDEHIEAFKEIQLALVDFRKDMEKKPKIRPTELKDLRKAYLSLSVIQGVNRLMLMDDPEEPDGQARYERLPIHCKDIVSKATELFRLESKVGCLRSGGSVPNATVSNPLTFLVKSGFHRATREQAVQLLQVPRVEGIWDSHMASALAKKMLARETAASQEYRLQPHLNNVVINHPTARGWDSEVDREYIHPLGRICNYTMTLSGSGGRDAIIVLKTWKDWLEGAPGTKCLISW